VTVATVYVAPTESTQSARAEGAQYASVENKCALAYLVPM